VFRIADDLLAFIVASPLWLFCIARRIDIACQSGDLNLKGPFEASRCVAQSVCTAITFWPRSIGSGAAAVYTLADVQIPTEYTLVSWENHHDVWFEGSSTSFGFPCYGCGCNRNTRGLYGMKDPRLCILLALDMNAMCRHMLGILSLLVGVRLLKSQPHLNKR
jgi:hypothetical protein